MKEGVIVRVTRKTELGDTCGIVREMEILGGKRIVEGTGNFRRIGNCGGGGRKNQISEILHHYGITSQLYFSL